MHAVDLISNSLDWVETPEEPKVGTCCVTGETCSTIARKHAIKPSFTNWDRLRAPDSDRVGISAWRALSYEWERKSSWTCDGREFVRLHRKSVRERVFDFSVFDRPRACYATTSYKKHGVLWAPVNSPGRKVWAFETRLVDCSDEEFVQEIWGHLRSAQDAGISRTSIETLEINQYFLSKVGWRAWRDFERWAKYRVNSPLYAFLTYLLPSVEELKTWKEPFDSEEKT